MPTRIKSTHFRIANMTKVMDFLRVISFRKPAISLEGASHFYHNFTLFFFDNEIGIDKRHNQVKCFTAQLNIVDRSIIFINACRTMLLPISATNKVMNPLDKILVRIRNFDIGVIIHNFVTSVSGNVTIETDDKTSFSINNPSKVTELCICKFRKIHRAPNSLELPYSKLTERICPA